VAHRSARTLVSGDGRSVDAVADSRNDTSDDELCERVGVGRAGNLDDYSDDHDDSTEDHALATTKQIANGKHEDGTEETADLVDGSDQTLHGRVAPSGCEEVVEGGGGDDTRHDTGAQKSERVSSSRERARACVVGCDSHPWSYPNSKKPVVATVETASDRGLPERPMNFGGAMAAVLRYAAAVVQRKPKVLPSSIHVE
jgi:hypothetical protein